MSNFSLSSWKELCVQALLKLDKEELTELVQATEVAIGDRARYLSNSSEHQKERREMAVAHASVLSIKTQKLGWPPVSANDGLC